MSPDLPHFHVEAHRVACLETRKNIFRAPIFSPRTTAWKAAAQHRGQNQERRAGRDRFGARVERPRPELGCRSGNRTGCEHEQNSSRNPAEHKILPSVANELACNTFIATQLPVRCWCGYM